MMVCMCRQLCEMKKVGMGIASNYGDISTHFQKDVS